jgi:hypothetical protein
MHQHGVEVHYFLQLLSSSTSNFDDSVNDDNLLVTEVGEGCEAMDFDSEMTRLVAGGIEWVRMDVEDSLMLQWILRRV